MPSNIKPKNALPDEDLIRKFYLHSRNFVLYLSQNSIYLPKIIVDRFAGAEYSLKSMVQSVIKDGSDENKKRLDAHYDQNLRQLFEELKNEIRDLLGVEESDFETLHIKK
jgi:predicted metal-dependent hydrolase